MLFGSIINIEINLVVRLAEAPSKDKQKSRFQEFYESETDSSDDEIGGNVQVDEYESKKSNCIRDAFLMTNIWQRSSMKCKIACQEGSKRGWTLKI